MKPIFKDKKQQTIFEKNGFIKVRLLNEKQVTELVELFRDTCELHKIIGNLHHTTTDTQNADLIYKVDAKIKSIFVPELEKILLNFKSLSGCFHIKEPGPGSATGIHQDPTFVDESKYCSANVWVALQDIDKENGNLFFVSGSNHVSSSLRTTPESPCYYESFYELLPEMAIHVPLKRGEAVIFNNATIHGATENLTDTIRLASTLLVCSYEAQWLLYYKEKIPVDDQIEEYCLDLDAFVAMPKDGRPYSKALRKMFPYKFDKITKEDFLERIGNGRRQKKNYFERIRQAFTMRDGA